MGHLQGVAVGKVVVYGSNQSEVQKYHDITLTVVVEIPVVEEVVTNILLHHLVLRGRKRREEQRAEHGRKIHGGMTNFGEGEKRDCPATTRVPRVSI